MNVEAPQSFYDSLMSEVNKEREEHDRELARSDEPTDLDLPEGIDHLMVGDTAAVYRRARAQEKEVDALITRTYARYRELMKLPRTQLCCLGLTPGAFRKLRLRKMRIIVSNTAQNQPWESKELDDGAFDFNSGMESTYRVTIRCQMLPERSHFDAYWKRMDEETPERYKDDASDQEEASPEEAKKDESSTEFVDKDGVVLPEKLKKKRPIKPRDPILSDVFKRMVVEWDRPKELQPDGFKAVEWKKPEGLPPDLKNPPSGTKVDEFNFTRKGDENMNVKIHLWRDEQPEYFKLSKALQEILLSDEATREEVMWGIWEYCRYFELPRDDEARVITCDEDLKKVSFPSMPHPSLSIALPHQTFVPSSADC